MKHTLSKSTFMYGCQCPKRLFLHKFRPDLKNPINEQQQAVFNTGTSVGELAQKLFPGGVDVTPPDSYSYEIAVAKTKELIEQGATIIYEASFQYEGVLCALDILVKKENTWYGFEVKSTSSVKPQHVQDASLQYFVVTNSGITLQDFSIIHLNNQYVRKGELDIEQLFTTTSILEEVLEQQVVVFDKVRELKWLLAERIEPTIDIGPHCAAPYDCDFTNHCWAHIPKVDSVFDLARGPVWKLYGEGYTHLDKIPQDYELNEKVAHQLAHYRSGEVQINAEALNQFLAPLTYPLYFFDFETIMPGIPEFENSKPYQQIPFQFSLHIQHEEFTELEHCSFLGDGITDPRLALIEEMVRLLGKNGSIICYNMGFEKTRIKDLALIFPDYREALLAINERVLDLMIPFQKRWYYHPEFKGRYSIKKVLPVLIPDLRYDTLEIQEGGAASLVYSQLKYQDEDTRQIQRKQLLAYCRLDTLAMVRILDYLKKVSD